MNKETLGGSALPPVFGWTLDIRSLSLAKSNGFFMSSEYVSNKDYIQRNYNNVLSCVCNHVCKVKHMFFYCKRNLPE